MAQQIAYGTRVGEAWLSKLPTELLPEGMAQKIAYGTAPGGAWLRKLTTELLSEGHGFSHANEEQWESGFSR